MATQPAHHLPAPHKDGVGTTIGHHCEHVDVARILIADDDAGYRLSFIEGMRAIGHEVTGVDTTDAVLPALETGDFDIAFLDIYMSGGGAIALLPYMRQRGNDTPVVVITGRIEVFGSAALEDTMRLARAKVAKSSTLADLDTLVTTICAP